MIDAQIQSQNKLVLDGLMAKDAGLQKEASNGVNDYLRIRAREDGFARRILPPAPVSASDFDRQVDTVKPVITVLGQNPQELDLNESFPDTGASAIDDVDGDISHRIVKVNPVNFSSR